MKRLLSRLLGAVESLSVQQAALILSVGLVAGVFPMAGVPTVLCLVAACRLRVNLVAVQLVNQISAPLQWALLIPLERTGARLCGTFSPPGMGLLSFPLHAAAGWACVCVPLGIPLYYILVFVLRRRLAWFNRLENPA